MGERLARAILLVLSLAWRPVLSDTGSAAKSDRPVQYSNIRSGVTVSGERFPYVCYVFVTKRTSDPPESSNHYCGGVLFRKRWLITVAHCVHEVNGTVVPPTPIVYCGFNDRFKKQSAQSSKTKKIHLHDSFTGNRREGYDIAIVELENEIHLDSPTVADQDFDFNTQQKLATVAWGRISDAERTRYLQMADNLVYVTPEECKEYYEDLSTESPWICAKSADHEQDSCRGDCGGPLLIPHMPGGVITAGDPKRDLVVGIKTYGIVACDGKNPDVYVRVAPFWDWIISITEKSGSSTKNGQGMSDPVGNVPQIVRDGMVVTETIHSADEEDGTLKTDADRMGGLHFEDLARHGLNEKVEIT